MDFRVLVDDNFHYRDHDERYELGKFPTSEAAIEAAQRVVDKFLMSNFHQGITAQQLFSSYTSFGEDPFVVCDGAEKVSFSAWDYARQRCHDLCNAK